MLMPSIFTDDLFDDWMEPAFGQLDRHLYGKNANRIMKTDIHERDDCYDMEIDLPGFKKDQLKLCLNHGYLTITAEKHSEIPADKDAKRKPLRRERYTGTQTRSFYVGDSLTESDIKARFEDGVLTLTLPKKKEALPHEDRILIE